MKVNIEVKPGSKRGPYIQLGIDGSLLVCVKEPPLDGRANEAVIKLLGEYYGVPKSNIILKSGHRSKYKTFQIND